MKDMSGKLGLEQAKSFILGGHAIVTFKNIETQKRYTYKIMKHEKEDIFFVSVMYGSDNNSDYVYIGTIFENGEFKLTKKSKLKPDDVRVRGFDYVYRHVCNKTLIDIMEIWHSGYCGRCGRLLTKPESILTGFGHHCYGQIVRNKSNTNVNNLHKSRNYKPVT